MKFAYKPSTPGLKKAMSVSLWDGVVELFKQPWHATLAAWRQIGLIWVLGLLGGAVGGGAIVGLIALDIPALGAIIGGIILIAVVLWFQVAMTRAMHMAIKGKEPDWKVLNANYAVTALRFVGVSIAVAAITIAGFFLFFVPALIWSHMFFAAPYAVLVDGKTVGEALKWSRELTKGRKLNIAVVYGLAGGFWVGVYYLAQALGLLIDLGIGFSMDSMGVFYTLFGIISMLFYIPIALGLALMTYESLKARS